MSSKKVYFDSNLKYLRKLNRKTQNDIALVCNRSNKLISCWENGTREPEMKDVLIISNYFNINLEDLLSKDLILGDKTVHEKVTSKEFMNEVLPLIDKIENLKEKEKNKLKEEIKYICEDD